MKLSNVPQNRLMVDFMYFASIIIQEQGLVHLFDMTICFLTFVVHQAFCFLFFNLYLLFSYCNAIFSNFELYLWGFVEVKPSNRTYFGIWWI
uniref:Uncharacterized protein n=1 Tax=Rhizophora mucronata TaxID=61149 RepID=A0A2P2PL28_RHIMU